MKRFNNFHHIFIYGFGYFYSKQRLQQRHMAELVRSSSNKHTTQSDVIRCYPMFESDDYHCEFSPSNNLKKIQQKI